MRARPAISSALLLLVASPALAAGFEAGAELSLGPQHLWCDAGVRAGFFERRLQVGAGAVLLSDYHASRGGGRVLLGTDLGAVGLSLALGYAPRQDERGWISLEPEITIAHSAGALQLDWAARVALRRADVLLDASREGVAAGAPGDARSGRGASQPLGAQPAGPAVEPVSQLQVQVELSLAPDDRRLELRLLGDLSLYNRDLARPGRAGADFGPLIAIAAFPERWAARGELAVRTGEDVAFDVGLAVVGFEAAPGTGLMPELGIALGPFGGARVALRATPLLVVGGAEAPGVAQQPGTRTGASAVFKPMVKMEVTWER